MPVAARGQDLRIHAATVVADEDAEVACGVFNFHHDLHGARMPKRVGQRFPANEIYFVANGGPQLTGRTFDDVAKFALRGNGEIFLDPGKLLFQIFANDVRWSKTPNRVAA